MFRDATSPMPTPIKVLLLCNVVLFVLDMLTGGRYITPLLALSTPHVFADWQIWRVFTYMFVHDQQSVFHVLFNMLMLWMFGTPVAEYMGAKKFTLLYLASGVFAGFCSVGYDLITGNPVSYVGASGAVYGIMVAFAFYFPYNQILIFFLFPVAAKWAVTIFIGIDLLLLTRNDGIAHITHLGGALLAFLYLRYAESIDPFFEKIGSVKETFEDKKSEWTIQKKQEQRDEVDRILSKISREGMHSLSRSEKSVLEKASGRKKSRKLIPFKNPFDPKE